MKQQIEQEQLSRDEEELIYNHTTLFKTSEQKINFKTQSKIN